METVTLANGRIWRRQIRPRWHPDAAEAAVRSGGHGLSVDINRSFEYAAQAAGLDESLSGPMEAAVERTLDIGHAHLTWFEMPLLRSHTQAVAHSIITWPQGQTAPPEERLAALFAYVDENGKRVQTTKRAWLYSDSSADLIAIFSDAVAAEIRTQLKEHRTG